LKSLS